MTDAEARAWLEEHRAQLELIVLTARLRGDGVRTPGTGYARLALQVHRSMINRAHNGGCPRSECLKIGRMTRRRDLHSYALWPKLSFSYYIVELSKINKNKILLKEVKYKYKSIRELERVEEMV